MNRTPPPSSLGSRGKIPEKGFCEACLLVSDQWVQSLFFFLFLITSFVLEKLSLGC